MGFIQSATREADAPVPHEGLPFFQQMTFPVELSLRTTPGGIRLFRRPVKEIQQLYTASRTWADTTVAVANDEEHLGSLSPDLMDMSCTFSPDKGDKITFRIRGVYVHYTQSDGRIRLKNNAGVVGETIVPAGQDEKGWVKIRVLFDRTSLEIFVNDGVTSATLNCVPLNRKLSIDGPQSMIINELTVHELGSIWQSKE